MKHLFLLLVLLVVSPYSSAIEFSEKLLKKAIVENHTKVTTYNDGTKSSSYLTRALDRLDNPVTKEDITFITFSANTAYFMSYNPIGAAHDGLKNLISGTKHDYDSIEARLLISEKEYFYTCSFIETRKTPTSTLNKFRYFTYFNNCKLQDLETGSEIKLIYKSTHRWRE